MPGRYDRIMLAQRVTRSRTCRRLDDGEFRAFIAALCLAGQSPVRGCLLISESEAVTVDDIADEAAVDVAVAQSAVDKLIRLETLVEDTRRGCLRFVNWSRYNPSPRPSDSREATRERKRRQRAREAATKLEGRDRGQTKLGKGGSSLHRVEPSPGAGDPPGEFESVVGRVA